MSAHHSKIEHFVIHVVATLFLFSTIAATFLGYDVYVNKQSDNITPGSTATKVLGYVAEYQWTQNDWSAGTSTQTFAINWPNGSTWKKYSSATNISPFSGGGMEATAPGGTLISSILDLGPTYRTWMVSYDTGNEANTTVYVRGANSEVGISSTSWVVLDGSDWVSVCLGGYRYIQYKVQLAQTSDQFFDFWIKSAKVAISGNAGISGATVTANGISTTTAYNNNRFFPKVYAAGQGQQPGNYDIEWIYKTSNPTSFSVTASKSGYKSQTKTATINPSTCDFSEYLNFNLTKISSSSSSSNSNSESTTSNVVPTTTTDSITKVKLPSGFTKERSKTTDLSEIKDPKKVKDLVLDVVGTGTIKFNETVDLSANKTIAAFEQLNKYLVVKNSYVELNSKILSALNKKATITMHKLKHLTTPEILVDGGKGNSGVVSNISYDPKSGKLTFDVAHFTKFEAAVKFEILSPTSTQVTDPDTSIKVGVSDPATTITGSFNGVELGKITPDKKTGEFTLEKLVFEEGENILKLGGESKLGKVAPLAITFTYGQGGTVDTSNRSQSFTALVVVLLSTLVAASILGYLIYRRKKLRAKIGSKEDKEPNETITKDSK